MTTVATLDTVMRLNSSAFRAGMISAAGQANQSLGSIQQKAAETASVLLSLKRAANTFGSFYLVKEGIASLIDAQKQLQAIHYTLEAATGSSTAAEQAFGFVRAEADKLGLVLPTAAQGFANLSASATAAGVSMKDQQELFDAYAKSSTTLHLSTEQSGRALLALEQMFAKGKIQAQELRLQLGQAIPGAAQRFQNAVMEMTKGTNLAGKSFDQLLAAGELTTSKFLPALTLALTQSGRGWEDASNGLNSNLNRVQTAWFNLKSEVSGGLFNDLATGGAGLLASQLDHIATTASLIAAGGLARVIGGGLKTGAGKINSITAGQAESEARAANSRIEAEATLKAAQAEQELAAAQVKTATAAKAGVADIRAQNAERLASAEIQRRMATDTIATSEAEVARTAALGKVVQTRNAFTAAEALGATEAARAVALAEAKRVESAVALTQALSSQSTAQKAMSVLTVENAAAQKALAAADLEVAAARAFSDAPDPRIIELTARQQVAQEALAASQTQLTKATATEAQATRAAISLKAQAVEANTALERSNVLLAVSEDAVAAAQTRVVEMRALETAAGSLSVAVGKAAKSFGSFALSLVGGPWGAAVAAVAGLAYAFYSSTKEAEKTRAEIEKTSKSTEATIKNAMALSDAFNTAGNADPFSKLKDSLSGIQTSIDQNQKAIDEYQKKLAYYKQQSEISPVYRGFLELTGQYKAAQDATEELTRANESLMAEYSSQNSELVAAYAKNWAKVGDAIRGITFSVPGVLAGLDDVANKVKKAISDDAAVDTARASLKAYADGGAQELDSLQKKLRQTSMTAKERLNDDLKTALAEAKKGGVDDPGANEGVQARRQAIVVQGQIDAAEAGKKATAAAIAQAKANKEAYAQAMKTALDRVAADSAVLEGDNQITVAEKERAKVVNDMDNGNLKVTASERLRLIAVLDTSVALEKANVVETNHQRSLAKTAALEDQLAARIQNRVDQNEIDAAGVGHGTEMVQKLQDELRIRQDYQKQVDQLNKDANKPTTEPESRIGGVDYNARLAEIQKALSEETLLYQQGAAAKKAAELDWTNGARAALEDYKTAAENVAGLVQQTWADAMSGFEDTIVNGLTTGTFHFKQFAVDVLKEITRIEARIVISKVAGLLLSMFGGSTVSGAGDSLNGGSNYTGSGSMSTSWGRAGGGSVRPHTLQQVAENGRPELLHQNGNTYLMTGANGGNVTPITAAKSGGASMTPNVTVAVSVAVNNDGSSKSTSDSDNVAGKQLGDMMAGVAKQAIVRELQPNGILWRAQSNG